MTDEQRAQFDRIEAFKLDAPGASFPFSKRLAKENGWSTEYTRRVIAEYKRFAFLYAAAGHPVSPSEDVDQAWHLHMLYSENYWDEFCGKTLGRPLHHQPNQGMSGQGAKFEDWYAATLSSYVRLIGTPPSDIWPSPAARRTVKPDYQRVDRRTSWVIRKPWRRLRSSAGAVGAGWFNNGLIGGLLMAVALLVVGCTDAVKGPNPFDWMGPDFLQLYMVLFAVAYLLGWGLRYRLKVPLPGNVPAANLDPYEVTYLIAGPRRTVEAAVAELVRQGALALGPTGQLAPSAASYSGRHDFERRVFQLVPRFGVSFLALLGSAGFALKSVEQSLIAKGLVMAEPAWRRATLVPLAVCALPIVAGAVKVSIGVSRDRPVGDLIGLCVLSAIVSLVSFARRPYRSRYGDGVYRDLTARYAFLQGASMDSIVANAGPDSDDFAIAVGLYGTSILADTTFAALSMMMEPPVVMGGSQCNSGGDASCSSGDGSSCNSGGSQCNSGGGSSCNSGGSSCSSGDSGGSSGCGGCGGGSSCSS
jgi:uncharacterized protein (TIGR04222 family)